MRKSCWQLFALALIALMFATQSWADGNGRGLRVKVTYTGNGTVDGQHRIYVSVYDTSYIGHQGDAPLATLSLTENGQTAAFSGLKKSPVYVFAFFDKAGGCDPARCSPPSGAPAALYGKQMGIADPIEIEEGKTAAIEMTFDDSLTMP